MYDWRKIGTAERERLVNERKARRLPWHSPPHLEYHGNQRFILTAACFEHRHIIGKSTERMAQFESELLKSCKNFGAKIFAWCILPNHYHIILQTDKIRELQKKVLGQLHGRTSYRWNSGDDLRGRKVWFRSVERPLKSKRHFLASVNYVHHNPVKHGFVAKWTDWPFSSARNFIEAIGKVRATEIWKKYPILDYGKDWDVD
jgi:putative transposase